MATDAVWRDIRRLRANPPGLAGRNKGRSKVFAAALQQAEELHEAAAQSGYSSRPLPLFYALSQGGRAIAAARADADWQPSAHGLKAKFDQEDVLTTRVSPDEAGAFQTVSCATGSPTLDRDLTLGELLATLPGIGDSISAYPRALKLELEYESSLGEYHKLVPPHSSLAIYCGPEASLPTDQHLEAMKPLLEHCKRANGWGIVPNILTSAGRPCIALTWQLERADGQREFKALEIVATPVGDFFYIRPTLGRDGGEITILMTWWAVLLALSSLARYEPARWQKALNVDESEVAVTLEEVLSEAQDWMPELLYQALTG